MKEKTAGNCFSSLKAKGNLEPTSIIAFNVPATENIAPKAIIAAPVFPINKPAASASGLSDEARDGSVPMLTI